MKEFNLILLKLIIHMIGAMDEISGKIYNETTIKLMNYSNYKFINISQFCQQNFYKKIFFCGIGIVTLNNSKCIPWRNYKYQNIVANQNLNDLTLCKKTINNNSWCDTGNATSGYCKPISCTSTKSTETCYSNISWTSTNYSIIFSFHKLLYKNPLVLLFYTNTKECKVINICKNCYLLKSMINYYFNTCDILQQELENMKFIQIENLFQNKSYRFYIFPIIDNFTIGSIVEILLMTKLANNPTIKTFNATYINNKIKINWSIYPQSVMEATTFQLLIKDLTTNKCLHHIKYECQMCNNKLNKKWLNKTQLEILKNMTNCQVKENIYFSKSNLYFTNQINITNVNNISISLYSVNSLGLHQLQEEILNISKQYHYLNICFSLKNFIKKLFELNYYIIIIIVIAIVIVFIILLNAYRYRYLLFNKKKHNLRLDVPVSKDHMKELLNMVDNEIYYSNPKNEVSMEFENLCNQAILLNKNTNLTMTSGLSPEDLNTNEYLDMIPLDENKLTVKGKPWESQNLAAYFIPFEGNLIDPEYIVCQNSLQQSLSDFWLMVWEQKVSIIIMLSGISDYDEENFITYGSKKSNILELKMSIFFLEEKKNRVYTERIFKIEHKISYEIRTIIQLQFHSWKNSPIPKFSDMDTLLNRFYEITFKQNINPYFLHCNDNLDKVGTFIAIDRIIRKFWNGSIIYNIYKEVLQLKIYQNSMVTENSRYIFIHVFIKYYLDKYSSYFGDNCNNKLF